MSIELPPDLVEAARVELGETPEVRDQTLKELRAKLEELPEPQRPHRMDDVYLIAYLRGCKFRVDMAYKKINAMEKFRHDNAQYTENLRAEEFKEMYGSGFMRILNGHSREGHLISCLLPARMGHLKDPTVFMRWNFWCVNKVLMDPYLQVKGQMIIENFEDFSMINMIRMQSIPQSIMSKCFKMQNECAPMRMRGIFVVNQPKYMNFIWAIVRPFMSKKLRDRVHFIGKDNSAFHEFIDPSVLPHEFGGTLDEAPTAWLDKWIEEERLHGPSVY